MTFEEILDQAIALLQRRGRLTYRALKRQLNLDDDYLEDVKAELIKGQRLAVDEDGEVLVWTSGTDVSPRTTPPAPQLGALPGTADALHPLSLSVATVPPSPDAERRQLTVLFCDLVDSTALSTQLDPEDYREVVRAYQATCAEVIQRFDGHIAQYLGDGLLVYFGYPRAHEDTVQRAVRSGLGMVEAMGALNTRLEREYGVRLAVRLGIHTGLVVVGEIGSGGRQEQLALGETPNLAARLQGMAAPDTVVISEATAHLIQGYFVCQPLGAPALKGLPQPLQVYQVLWESGAQTRLDVVPPRGLTPLVGRDEEVRLLQRRWEQASTGLGQVALLSGEAGIGKSRLVQMLKEHIAATPHTRIEWRGSPYHQQSALYPVIDQLQRLLTPRPQALDGSGDGPGPLSQRERAGGEGRAKTPSADTAAEEGKEAAKLRALEAALSVSGMALPEAVPLLAALLSLPLPASYPPLTLAPQRQRQKTLEILLAWLHAEAQRQPILLVVEDLHWVDPSTVELLSLLIDQCAQWRLCLVLTARPEFHPPWAMVAHFTALTLRRFAPDEIGRLVTHVVGDKAFPPAVLQEVVRKTDGVPLFVEELTKTVLESQLLEEQEDRYVLHGPLPPLAIPATLQDALLARLDRLAAAKVVAQLGATIGRTFAYDVVQAVVPLDAAALQGALAQLVEAEVVAQRGLPPQATYTFKHALIQDAAYQSLLRSTRQQYHQRIAQVLAERFPETAETQPEVLAQHYTAAGLHDQALPYWQRAGQRALERSAHREAVGCLEQALSALPHLPQKRDTREQAIDLRLSLRDALHPLGDFGRVLTLLREAEVLAETLDDTRRLGQVLASLSMHFYTTGMYDQAIAAAQRTHTLATAGENVVLQALANHRLGIAYRARGDYRRAIDCFGQTVAFLGGTRRRERFGQTFLPAVNTRAEIAWCHAELGTFAEGLALGEEGLRIAEEVAHSGSVMVACWGGGELSLRQGNLPMALSLLERAVGLCHETDLPAYFPRMAGALGAAYSLCGRLTDAVPLLTQALERAIATEMVGYQARCRLPLGEAQMLSGCLEEAHAHAERALAHARAYQERGNEAYALRLLGDIAARREPPDVAQAEVHYQHTLALATELGMRPLQAHCHYSLGTLYSQTGRAALARAALSTAIELYRAMDMIFWLPAAEAALAQVERP
jgi:class 3 adenylate cyclase/tetratricopeptide (TPR) repeat protein